MRRVKSERENTQREEERRIRKEYEYRMGFTFPCLTGVYRGQQHREAFTSFPVKYLPFSFFGLVRELLISSEKTSASLLFAENEKRFSCLCFSITHPHGPKSQPLSMDNLRS
jgi:hypothetical protein